MAFTAPTDTIQSTLTNQGRDMLARSLLGQMSFHLIGFKVGRDGYDMGNPVKVSGPPDPGATDLVDPVFPVPTTTTQPFVVIENPFPNVVAPVCRINRADCLFGLGELGVWVRVDRADPPADALYTVGSDYMFAWCHFPLASKTSAHVFVYRLIVAV